MRQPAVRRHLILAGLLAGVVLPAALWAKAPAREAQTPAEPDVAQQMDRFTMSGYAPEGTKRWELIGSGATVEGDIVTIRRPDAIGYNVAQDGGEQPGGPPRTAYLQASLAQVEQSSRRIRMEHDVAIHTSDGLWLFSPLMYWLPDKDELTTDQPVRMETDHMLLYGYGATGQTQLKQAVILRDIDLLLNPDDSPGPGQSGGNSHVRITCDGPLTFDYHRYIATFEQHVHVNDGQTDLYSDKLVAYLHKTNRTITYADATGHVHIIQGPHTADSQRAIYEPASGKVTLLGAPSLLVYPEADQPPGGGLAESGIFRAPGVGEAR